MTAPTSEYVLLASVFYQRQEDGRRHRYTKGDTITGLPAAAVQRLTDAGAIASKSAKAAKDAAVDAPAPADKDKGPAQNDHAAPERPARVAPKDEWVAYVVAKTEHTDSPIAHDEADAMTKAELIKQYG